MVKGRPSIGEMKFLFRRNLQRRRKWCSDRTACWHLPCPTSQHFAIMLENIFNVAWQVRKAQLRAASPSPDGIADVFVSDAFGLPMARDGLHLTTAGQASQRSLCGDVI